MTDQTAQEPTMEEILASIRRIISEDDAPAAASPATEATPEPEPEPVQAEPAPSPAMMDETPSVQSGSDDVLELTERYEEPSSFQTVGDIDVSPRTPEPEPEPAPIPTPAPTPAPASDFGGYDAPRLHTDPEALLSPRAEDSAVSAFGQLAGALLMPRDARTLEDVVREMLRPMLKEWLDSNLPSIVEAQVRAEVERIARRGVR